VDLLAAARAELARVLHSETFRNSDGLRQLLTYLGEKSLAETPVELKEYTIGTDACGKPPTYDPQKDASVRVQVGRLRMKLDDYYSSEGAGNSITLELPKGRFTLLPHVRQPAAQPDRSHIRMLRQAWRQLRGMRRSTGVLILLLAGSLALAAHMWRLSREHEAHLWISRQEEAIRLFSGVWGPFLTRSDPPMAVFGSPGFLASRRFPMFVRLYGMDDPDDPRSSPHFSEVDSAVGPLVGPRFDYASMGDAVAIQRLTAFFGSAGIPLKALPAHLVAWEALGDSNLIFVGAWRMHPLLRRLPVRQDFELGSDDQIYNRNPQHGEQQVYTTPSHRDSMTYAVVGLYPGLKPGREVLVLTAHSSPGAMAAADFVTSPGNVRIMEQRIGLSGKTRRYFQMLLRVHVDKDVPIQTQYVTHHLNQ
jgi:hypothetical protein